MFMFICGFLVVLVLVVGLVGIFVFVDEIVVLLELIVIGNVVFVIDYCFCGILFLGGDVVVQGLIGVSYLSGFYVGIWVLSLEDILVYGYIEVDFYVGWIGVIGLGLIVDVGLFYYVYLNGKVGYVNVFEFYVLLIVVVGLGMVKVGVNYVWDQDLFGGDDNFYFYIDFGVVIFEIFVLFLVYFGWIDGVLLLKLLIGVSIKLGFDYNIGVIYNIMLKFLVGVQYVGVDGVLIDSVLNDIVVGMFKLMF